MKALRNLMVPLIAFVLSAGLALNFVGCTNNSPITPEDKSELHFIPLGNGNPSLNKIVKVSAWVTKEDGGELVLEFKAHKKKGVQVTLVLEVPPESISEDAELTLSIDDELLIVDVDITFGPSGITFSKPALLSVDAKWLDFSEIESRKEIGFYYYNPDTGEWERIEVKNIQVNLNNGKIMVDDAKIPHFSRYAVAWSN